MAADSTSSAVRQTVNYEADPLHPKLNDGVDEFTNALRKAEDWSLMPEIADESGMLRVLVDPKYLPRPRASQAPVVPQAPVPSKLDNLYAKHFRRLELNLEAGSSHEPASVTETEGRVATLSLVRVSAEGEAVFEPTLDHVRAPQAPVVPQAHVPSELDSVYARHFRRLELDLEALSSHEPASVTEGRVATLSLVRVSAEGEAVFEPTLEDHVAAPAK